MSDLRPDDKINYNTAEKIMAPHISELLSEVSNTSTSLLKVQEHI